MSAHDLSRPMSTNDLFHLGDGPSFETLACENGTLYWSARSLMEALGYDTFQSFDQVINKAISVCLSLKLPVADNFTQTQTDSGARDYKLSRFACYLVAMNSNPTKPQVARAQAYFAAVAEAFDNYVREAEHVERVQVRAEIADHERGVSSAAKGVGVNDFARFQNAGYLGLYNLPIWQLRKLKGVPETRSPLDFMGKTELAANLFRITQTEEALKRGNVKGQQAAERVARDTGKIVRDTMEKISGVRPESLPPARDIREVHKSLKGSAREFKKLDAPKSTPSKPSKPSK